jgi:SOS response regulatory protein OraA/RecX
MNNKEKRTAKEELTRYLGTRMRTVAEARNHLAEKEYEAAEIQEVIERFLQLGYLDDVDYARAYCEYAYGKGRGRIRIAAELKQRGVDTETAQNAIEDYLYEAGVDELSLARKQAEKVLAEKATAKESHLPLNPKLEARIARKLEQLGYSTSIILRVLSEIRARAEQNE